MNPDRQVRPANKGKVFRSANKGKVFRFIYRLLVGFLFAFVILLNLQPWFMVGGWLAESIINFPFVGPLLKIPFLGGLIQGILSNLIDVAAVTLWLIVQLIQVARLATESSLVADWIQMTTGIDINRDPAMVERLAKLAGYAYALELFICLLRYPIYGNGFEDVLADLFRWDMALFSWGDIVLAGLTMCLFELVVWLAAFLSVSVFSFLKRSKDK